MRTDTGAVHPEDTLARAAERMAALGVREVPVTEHGRLAGILCQCDLLPHRGHYEWTQVRDVMTRELAVVPPETAVPELARLLLDRGINAVPVVVDGRLVGMVSRAELLRPLAAGGDPDHAGDGNGNGGNGGGNGNGHDAGGGGHGAAAGTRTPGRRGAAPDAPLGSGSCDRSPPPG